jgi:phospholipid/cholesterol/gamma-HCH transport system ATP-binding protein
MIEIVKLNKTFGDTQVLFDISTQFHPGITNLVIGSSGGGKSVLMKCMVGLLKPTNGHIYYDKRDFTALDSKNLRDVRRDIGMLFQGTALFDSLTVEENVEFPLKMFSDMSVEERKERVNFCLRRVDLENINDKFQEEISGGMKKRVGIASAIALHIKYLFCDEPNSGLDPLTSRLIDDLLHEITREFNITTIINSHDMKTVFDIGEKIVFIYEGKIGWEGNKEEVNEAVKSIKPLHQFLEASHFITN